MSSAIRSSSLRWQILLAFLGLVLVLAILSFQVQQETAVLENNRCTTSAPIAGGDFIEGMVGAPRFINPLLSDPYPVDRELVDLLFDGLTRHDKNGRLIPALAEKWTVAENGRSVQFTLREGISWHDGTPVTAADVSFTYGLIQQDEFPGLPAIHTLWKSVTIELVDPRSIIFHLAEPYAPFLEETTRGILPAHLLEGVTAVTLPDHPFNQSPVGTGLFKVADNQNWQQSGQLLLLPNETYWQKDTQLTHLGFRFFPNEVSRMTALKRGEIHAITHLPDAQLPEAAAYPSARLNTTPHNRYTMLLFNQSTAEARPLQIATMRHAVAYSLDRRALIDDQLNGQGLLFEGPYLPESWASDPALLTTIAYNPISSTLLLEEVGWLMPEGGTVRVREGEALILQLVGLNAQRELITVVANQLAAVGIETEASFMSNIDALQTVLADGNFDVALVDVVPSYDPDLYDFWSQEAMIRGQNYGQWNNQRASEALEGGRQLWRVEERLPFYDAFLRIYNVELPAITLYQHLSTYVITTDVKLADIGLHYQPRDRYRNFDEWFLHFKDIPIPCPTTIE